MVGKRKSNGNSGGTPEKRPRLQASSGKKSKPMSFGPALMRDDDDSTLFPRGGQENLTPLEKRVIHQQVKQDLLFSEEGNGDKGSTEKTSSKKHRKCAVGEKNPLQGKRAKILNIMSTKKLLPGVLILGAVLEIHEFELIISLPFNMRGSVAISDISDLFTEHLRSELELEEEENSAGPSLATLFSRGQLFPCYVVSVDGGRVALSVNPRLVNARIHSGDIKAGMILPGSVKSIEDHGYIIDFSVEGKTGFLLKKNATEVVKRKGKSLAIGQVVCCLVLGGADARAVPVSINPSQIGGALLPGDMLMGVNALLPGALVNAAVEKVGSNGVSVTFLSGLEGTVSSRHLQNPSELTTEKYHPKKKFKARILWVDTATKTAGLTLQKQVVCGNAFTFEGVEIGDSFQAAKIVHIDNSKGLFLELDNDIIGYSPSWMLTDEKDKPAQELVKSTHRPGSLHPCRIVQFNLLDGCPIVSLQASVLEKPYMRYSDLSVGLTVEGKVERFGEFGMIIGLTDTIRGLCMRTHISDTRTIMKQPRKKYKEGSKVKARVLFVEPSQNRLLLTCKKSLIRSTHEPLANYTDAKPGDLTHGVVTSIRSFGLIVNFFNKVRGIVLKSELGIENSISDFSSVFWTGQSVECRVLECDPDKQRLLLSLQVDKTATAVSVADNARVKVESFVRAEVTGIASNGINLRCSETGEVLFLPTFQLSDHAHHCAHLLSRHQAALEKCVKKGKPYVLEDLLVLSEKAGYTPAQVTLKRALVRHSRDTGFVKEFTDLKIDTVQPGVVKKLMPYGCFIEFPHQLSGLAPTKYLTDEFVSGPEGLYHEMQTVWCKVMQVDNTKGKFLLSLRPSDVLLNTLEDEELKEKILTIFRDYIEEQDSIVKELAKSSGSAGNSLSTLAKAFSPGNAVTGHVISVGDHVTLDLGNGVVGRAAAKGASLEAGTEVSATVLEIDLVECCLILSFNPQLLPNPGRLTRSASKRKSVVNGMGDPGEATVEYKTSSHFVLSYSRGSELGLAYGVMDSGQLGVLPTYFNNLKVGQKVSTTILLSAEESSPSLPVLLMREPSVSVQRTSPIKADKYGIKIGDIIEVIVHSVKANQVDVRYHFQKGRIHASLCENTERDCVDDVMVMSSKKGLSVLRGVKSGDKLRARVVKVKARQITGLATRKGATLDVLELTTKPSLMDPTVELDGDALLRKSYSAGEEVAAVITHVRENGLQVSLNPRAEGFVPQILTSDNPERLSKLKMHYSRGQAVYCTVLGCESGKGHLHSLSMIGKVEPCEGGVVWGRVSQVIPGQALLVSTPYGSGRVDITDISDCYVEDPLTDQKGSIRRCCLVSKDGSRLDFSMRASRTSAEGDRAYKGNKEEENDPEIETVSDLSEGQVLQGYIKAVTDVGVFVRLGRSVDGRVKITHLTDGFIKNFKKHFVVGKLVKAKVLNIEATQGKVDLSLRLSHIDPEAAKKARKKQEKRRKSEGKKTTESQAASDGESVELETAESSSDEELGVDTDSEDSDAPPLSSDEEQGQGSVTKNKPTLQLSGGFQWDMGVVNTRGVVAENSSDSEEEEEPAPKKTKRQKRAAQKAEETQLYQTEQASLTGRKEPEGPEDFDRLLMASPNDSALWVKYMSFYLHTTEVEKARGVAQRALKTIGFREEKEKLNVWVAWMNLENLYGSQEALVKVFESALKENEPLEVFNRLVAIYEQSKKFDLADQLYQSMTKRFNGIPLVWTQYGRFLMQRGKRQAARGLLQRSVKSLARKKDHVQVIQKFAQLEFKHGEAERGITMFESLLSTYPKRIDIWSTFIDQMIKSGKTVPVRALFERVIHVSLSAQKMKAMFKRYLDFESKYGTPSNVEEVKMKAREYVETRTKQRS